MATIVTARGSLGGRDLEGGNVNLCTALTGNVDTTNTARRGADRLLYPGALVVTSTIGATPTVTVTFNGSVDGTNFYGVGYALITAPESTLVAPVTITTAVTTTYLLRPSHAWRYLKCTFSANTNVTLTIDAYL